MSGFTQVTNGLSSNKVNANFSSTQRSSTLLAENKRK